MSDLAVEIESDDVEPKRWADPVTDQSWRQYGACHDADFMHPGRGAMAQLREAIAICNTCPVKEPCLNYALITKQNEGVWGGTSGRQRRVLRRERGLTGRCGPNGYEHGCRCDLCVAAYERRFASDAKPSLPSYLEVVTGRVARLGEDLLDLLR